MTTNATIEVNCDVGDGSLAALSALIAKREQYLRGETTQNAVTATAINVLSSIRSRAKVAKPSDAKLGYMLTEAGGCEAGWKLRKRVVRERGGHTISSAKVVNVIGGYMRGEKPKVFVAIFKNERFFGLLKGEHYDRVYVIARSKGEAEAWAKNKLAAYIKSYRGMVKWAIGQAQSQIAQKSSGKDEIGSTRARTRALQHNFVSVMGDGFNSGKFSISYKNDLDYATLALKGGSADIALAIQKAANRTAGIVNRTAGYRLDEPIPTPFPEIITKKGGK